MHTAFMAFLGAGYGVLTVVSVISTFKLEWPWSFDSDDWTAVRFGGLLGGVGAGLVTGLGPLVCN